MINEYELLTNVAKHWFDRFCRFREKYSANGREIANYEMDYLDYLYGKYKKYEARAENAKKLLAETV